MQNSASYDKRGYLNEHFRIFHLRDTAGHELDYHYHDFDKIIIFISGCVDYYVEGVSYPLQPMDILLVGHHRIHKAQIDCREPYERIIIYIDSDFAEQCSTERTRLINCFDLAEKRGFCLVRPDGKAGARLMELARNMGASLGSGEFGADVLIHAQFLQTMVLINRMALASSDSAAGKIARFDPRITEVLSYISENLTERLTVDALAERCFYSKYHFMRRFRETTGHTVHSYIRKKRLLFAVSLLKKNTPAVRAASMSGFNDYSAFLRAFRGEFGTAPSEFTGISTTGMPGRE